MDFEDLQRVSLGLFGSGDEVTPGALDVVRHDVNQRCGDHWCGTASDFWSTALNYSVHTAVRLR